MHYRCVSFTLLPLPCYYFSLTSAFLLFVCAADAEYTRARKRQRIESNPTRSASATPTAVPPSHPTSSASSASRNIMRLTQSIQGSILSPSPDSVSEAGPSSKGYDGVLPKNGHTNGFSHPALTNGSSGVGNGTQKHGKSIARVNVPGVTLYEDSPVLREEFVRLVVQTLRDVGYMCVYFLLAMIRTDHIYFPLCSFPH